MNKSEIEFANEQSNKMSDLISVNNLLENSAQIEFHHSDGTTATYIAVKAIELEQQHNSIDAEPVRHGHWIDGFDTDGVLIDYDCSVCNMANDEKSDYCPNCGAKMEGCSNEE